MNPLTHTDKEMYHAVNADLRMYLASYSPDIPLSYEGRNELRYKIVKRYGLERLSEASVIAYLNAAVSCYRKALHDPYKINLDSSEEEN